MFSRPYWHSLIESVWRRRSVVWLSGVRRAGKTLLCQSLPDVEYFDCELPSVRRRLEDPELFLRDLSECRIVLDEVHRLPNPSELLKIAADHFPATRVLAFDTGFVCAWRGWTALRPENYGLLWEHYVLNELHATLQFREIGYWRDKRGHEVDFVIDRRGHPPLAIECKWRFCGDDLPGLDAFARQYSQAGRIVVANDASGTSTVRSGAGEVKLMDLRGLVAALETGAT